VAKQQEQLGWRDVSFIGEARDDSITLGSHLGPDESRSVMRVWFDPDDNYRTRRVSLSMPGRMTASELRRFPWDRWLYAAETFYRDPQLRAWHAANDAGKGAALKTPEAPPNASAAPRRPGRRGHPDSHYRQIAERYRQLVASGIGNPTATIAAERFANHNTVAGWLRVARQRGYLPPARRGRPG
jgi:hypothetical protein